MLCVLGSMTIPLGKLDFGQFPICGLELVTDPLSKNKRPWHWPWAMA